jgi:hypothetical protein
MDAGSLDLILKNYFSNGIKDEVLLASILKQVLIGIEYLHENKFINL